MRPPKVKMAENVCSECPFRKRSAAGWLGANDPDNFVRAAMTDESVACHTRMKQELPRHLWLREERKTVRCRGAAILKKNSCTSPRTKWARDLLESIEPDDDIFLMPSHCVEHHKNSAHKSWELTKK